MTDEFAICPNCGTMNSLINIQAEFPQVITKTDAKVIEKTLLCTKCWMAIPKDMVKYHTVGDEPDGIETNGGESDENYN